MGVSKRVSGNKARMSTIYFKNPAFPFGITDELSTCRSPVFIIRQENKRDWTEYYVCSEMGWSIHISRHKTGYHVALYENFAQMFHGKTKQVYPCEFKSNLQKDGKIILGYIIFDNTTLPATAPIRIDGKTIDVFSSDGVRMLRTRLFGKNTPYRFLAKIEIINGLPEVHIEPIMDGTPLPITFIGDDRDRAGRVFPVSMHGQTMNIGVILAGETIIKAIGNIIHIDYRDIVPSLTITSDNKIRGLEAPK